DLSERVLRSELRRVEIVVRVVHADDLVRQSHLLERPEHAQVTGLAAGERVHAREAIDLEHPRILASRGARSADERAIRRKRKRPPIAISYRANACRSEIAAADARASATILTRILGQLGLGGGKRLEFATGAVA